MRQAATRVAGARAALGTCYTPVASEWGERRGGASGAELGGSHPGVAGLPRPGRRGGRSPEGRPPGLAAAPSSRSRLGPAGAGVPRGARGAPGWEAGAALPGN